MTYPREDFQAGNSFIRLWGDTKRTPILAAIAKPLSYIISCLLYEKHVHRSNPKLSLSIRASFKKMLLMKVHICAINDL